jgi:hypothetical protein
MKRPLADKRPIGPLFSEDKSVLGVPGTPMPNRDKNPMVIVYKLDGNPVFGDDFKRAIQEEIDGMLSEEFGDTRVKYKRSGRSSKADFDSPAVILRVPGEELPIQDSTIHRVEQMVMRIADSAGADISVSEIFIEQE